MDGLVDGLDPVVSTVYDETTLRMFAAYAAGSYRPLGLDGWRVAFGSLAAAAAAAGIANLVLAADPLRRGPQSSPQLPEDEAEARQASHRGRGSVKQGAAPAGPEEELALLRRPERVSVATNSSSSEAPADEHAQGSTDGPGSGAGPNQADQVELGVPPPPAQPRLDLRGLLADVASVLRIPTFLIIVLQASGWLRVAGIC